MLQHTPSYAYVLEGDKRSFHHRWHVSDQIYECDACSSTCDGRAPYSQHWQSASAQQHTRLLLSDAEQRQLALIDAHRVQLFLLCNANVAAGAADATRLFLIEAGLQTVPQLLRLLYCDALQLRLKVGFDVRVQRQLLLFQSSELSVLHHFDIAESVDMLFHMLLQKIQMYVSLLAGAAKYRVQRIRLTVSRVRNRLKMAQLAVPLPLPLPLQYRVKHAVAHAAADEALMAEQRQQLPYHSRGEAARAAGSRAQLRAFTDAYRQHLREDSAQPAIAANLYAFQICHRSRELFAVPYHLVDAKRLLQTPSYIIDEDVRGRFRHLQQISNVRRFFRHDHADRVLICRNCEAHFERQTSLELHKMLQCGHAFEVLKLAQSAIEIYECCLRLTSMETCQWVQLYGVVQ